jgi:hypothetical protein
VPADWNTDQGQRELDHRQRDRGLRGDVASRKIEPTQSIEIPVATNRRGCDNRRVPVEGHLYGERVWFHDARGTVRRIGVSTHPADSTIVISLWQGDVCTGTFRFPAKEGARLISTLAYGMTEAIPNEPPESKSGPGRLRQIWSRFVQRLFVRPPGTTETHLRLLK